MLINSDGKYQKRLPFVIIENVSIADRKKIGSHKSSYFCLLTWKPHLNKLIRFVVPTHPPPIICPPHVIPAPPCWAPLMLLTITWFARKVLSIPRSILCLPIDLGVIVNRICYSIPMRSYYTPEYLFSLKSSLLHLPSLQFFHLRLDSFSFAVCVLFYFYFWSSLSLQSLFIYWARCLNLNTPGIGKV